MNIYTRTGDTGQTSVIGARVAKNNPRVEAYGTIDELNSFVGQTIAVVGRQTVSEWDDLIAQLTAIQHELFDCGSDLSYAEPKAEQLKVNAEMALQLEVWIDRYEAETPPIERFILPGGSEPAALLHVCRTVCRRAERAVVSLAEQQSCPEAVLQYLNRLSDYFFVAARASNVRLGCPDAEYARGARVFKRRERP